MKMKEWSTEMKFANVTLVIMASLTVFLSLYTENLRKQHVKSVEDLQIAKSEISGLERSLIDAGLAKMYGHTFVYGNFTAGKKAECDPKNCPKDWEKICRHTALCMTASGARVYGILINGAGMEAMAEAGIIPPRCRTAAKGSGCIDWLEPGETWSDEPGKFSTAVHPQGKAK